jgi:hypothetical protein
MALWNEITDRLGGPWTSNLLVGAATVVLAPMVVPVVMAGLRPVTKAMIQGSIIAYDKVGELISEAGEQLSDLVAEVRAEMATSSGTRGSALQPRSAVNSQPPMQS